MRFFLIGLFLLSSAFGSQVEISADKFDAAEASRQAKFSGNVLVTRKKDRLKADRLIVNFDKKRKPTKYEASGHASINMFLKGKEYFGKGGRLIYEPKINRYTIQGNAVFIDKTTDKKIQGEIIRVNQSSGKYEVLGKKNKPVKFIFKIDDEKVNMDIK